MAVSAVNAWNGADAAARSGSGGALDGRFALDVQGVDALRRTARNTPEEGMKQVSRQFEAMFMNMVLKSMREASATMNSGLLESQNEKVYLSMFDQQLSQSLSGRGLGLADAMLAQLQRTLAATGSADLPDQPPSAMPIQVPQARASVQGSGVPVMPVPRQAAPADLSIYQANGGPSAGAVASLQDHVDRFVARMGPSAQAASAASGVPAPLILAQAALESGWGKREIRGEDGAQSFNLFGIKADRSWKGPTVEVTTTEYVDGEPQKVRAKFRAYGSYDEAFTDYARFITRNPRYADVLATDDPAQAAHGLQRAGYATDPQYGNKLVRIMQKFG